MTGAPIEMTILPHLGSSDWHATYLDTKYSLAMMTEVMRTVLSENSWQPTAAVRKP